MNNPRYAPVVARASEDEVARAAYLLLAFRDAKYWTLRHQWRSRFLELFPGMADKPKKSHRPV